ncbi:MAG: D-alanyl-D-alanine carboxypeptidase/D-alanyl-D-alanine-endopeptidase [Pseudomonadota bacterium]
MSCVSAFFQSLQQTLTRLFVLCMLPAFVIAQQVESVLPPGIQLVISGHKLPQSSYSFLVQEINAVAPLLAINTGVPLNPASTMKTLTTLAGLEQLGPDYTWLTSIYALGTIEDGTLTGDLLIKGGGDPFLVEEHFRSMLKAVQRQGITRISGNLVLDTAYFDPAVSTETSIDNQSGRAYNVLPNALSVNFQTVTFFFSPSANGKDVVIHTDPVLPNLVITNNLKLAEGACTGYQRGIAFKEDSANPGSITFSGNFPASCEQYRLPRAVLDAPTYTFGMFQLLWKELGGEFVGELRSSQAPELQQPLLTWASPPLSDVIRSINKFSNNLMTRHMLLTLGAERYGAPATVEKGVQAATDYLVSRNIPVDGLVINNGAGLSREARMSTALLNGILQRGYSISLMPEFIASLPIGGIDGTMRDRLSDASTRGNMHVKTGSLDEVAAVAGYVNARSGKIYAVSGILNHELADRGPGIELMDALLAWTYEQ